MKSVVIFKSGLFDQSWPNDNGDPNTPPLGRDLAEHFGRGMAVFSVDVKVAIEATGGWELEVEINGRVFIFFFHWAPIGDPEDEYWVVQPRLKRKLATTLFKKRPNLTQDLEPAVDLLRKVIDTSSEFTNVQWFDLDEFRQIY